MEKNKEAQRGAGAARKRMKLIDADKLTEDIIDKTIDLQACCEYDVSDALIDIDNADTIDAIPTAWIVAQIQDTSGPESSYYSRLLRKWREENERPD